VLIPYTPVALVAAGGAPPYSWTISSGFLPAGLTLSQSSVNGTPSKIGTWAFTVRVIDSAGATIAAKKSIAVSGRLAVSQRCPSSKPCQVEAGCVNVCGKFGTIVGGVAPLKYSLAAGTLPTNMALNGLSLSGAFPAPATRGGNMSWNFTATVIDSLGVTSTVSASFFVFSHIAFSGSSYTCDGPINGGCSSSLPYTLGTPGLATPTVKVTVLSTTPSPMTATDLPPGYAYSITARSGTVTVSFPVIGCSIYQFDHIWVLSLVLVDQSQCSASAKCASTPAKVTVTLTNTC